MIGYLRQLQTAEVWEDGIPVVRGSEKHSALVDCIGCLEAKVEVTQSQGRSDTNAVRVGVEPSKGRIVGTGGMEVIVMLDTPQPLSLCAEEIGCNVEQLFTPLTRRNAQYTDQPFAMDNGAFAQFDEALFIAMLKKHETRKDLCRFVAVPDVVGSARRTIECFRYWQAPLSSWPLAFVCQDGQENFDIPWDEIAAVFIGGSTEWKMSVHAAHIVKAARILGTWSHVGRVNTPGRFEYFESLGADSCDGTGLARYSHMRKAIHENHNAPKLDLFVTEQGAWHGFSWETGGRGEEGCEGGGQDTGCEGNGKRSKAEAGETIDG